MLLLSLNKVLFHGRKYYISQRIISENSQK